MRPHWTELSEQAKPDTIERFDASTGDHIDTFTDRKYNSGGEGLSGSSGADGDLIHLLGVGLTASNPGDFPFRPITYPALTEKLGHLKASWSGIPSDLHASVSPERKSACTVALLQRRSTGNEFRTPADGRVRGRPYPIGVAMVRMSNLSWPASSDQTHINKLLAKLQRCAGGRRSRSIQRFDGRVSGKLQGNADPRACPFCGNFWALA